MPVRDLQLSSVATAAELLHSLHDKVQDALADPEWHREGSVLLAGDKPKSRGRPTTTDRFQAGIGSGNSTYTHANVTCRNFCLVVCGVPDCGSLLRLNVVRRGVKRGQPAYPKDLGCVSRTHSTVTGADGSVAYTCRDPSRYVEHQFARVCSVLRGDAVIVRRPSSLHAERGCAIAPSAAASALDDALSAALRELPHARNLRKLSD